MRQEEVYTCETCLDQDTDDGFDEWFAAHDVRICHACAVDADRAAVCEGTTTKFEAGPYGQPIERRGQCHACND